MGQIRSAGNRETEGRFLEILKLNRVTGWRRHFPLVGKPDFAFPNKHVAVFVDGCFWHGCPKHIRFPHSHRAYWRNKIAMNIRRDKRVRYRLRMQGWRVIRFWDHQLGDTAAVMRRLRLALSAPRLHVPAR